jgi:membrane-associated phospholipid phosphatase
MVVVVVLGAGVLAAGVIGALAGRWPAIEAPRVASPTIVEEVQRHRGLARHLRRHFDPKTETGVALTIATAIVAAAAVGVGVLLAMVRAETGLQSIDVRLARYGARNATAWSTDVLRWFSELGGTRGVILIAIAAGAVELIRRPSRAVPVFLALVVGGQFALSNGIKYLVERARPDFSRLTGFAGTSFPSGHSTAAAATLAAVALVATRGRSRRTKVVGAAIAAGLAVVVAGTRVFLGVHWFTDVVAGLLLGWGWFALCSIAFGGRLLTFGAPVATAEAVADVVPPEPAGPSAAVLRGETAVHRSEGTPEMPVP